MLENILKIQRKNNMFKICLYIYIYITMTDISAWFF